MRPYSVITDSDFLARCRDEVVIKALAAIAQNGMKYEAVLLAAVLVAENRIDPSALTRIAPQSDRPLPIPTNKPDIPF
jgi:hypothetical protein